VRLTLLLALILFPGIAGAQSRHTAIDGDTFRWRQKSYRLLGIDTPEARGCEPEIAAKAKARLQDLLDEGVRLRGSGTDLYQRTLAFVWQKESGLSVADLLIREGLGRPYYGSGPHPWCRHMQIEGPR
jgi:endonuclease YncB( thermonuclease family)